MTAHGRSREGPAAAPTLVRFRQRCIGLPVLLVAALALAWPLSGPAAASTAPAMRQGAVMYTQGRLAEAEAIFTRLASETPRDHRVWLWLGVVRFQRGEPAAAEVTLARAARLAPRDPVTLLWWGYALAASGRPVEAGGVLRHVALVPASPRARELATQALRALGPVPAEQAAPAPPPARAGPASPSWVLSQESYRAIARFYNPRLSAAETDRIAQALLGYSYHFNLDPRLVVALVVVESGFQPRAVSRAGAIGLGQLMPATARALGVDPWDPAQNLYGSIRYLRGNIDRFGWGNTHLALAAYNAGRGAVERYEGIPPYAETQWYVANVSSLYRRLLSVSGEAAQARGGI